MFKLHGTCFQPCSFSLVINTKTMINCYALYTKLFLCVLVPGSSLMLMYTMVTASTTNTVDADCMQTSGGATPLPLKGNLHGPYCHRNDDEITDFADFLMGGVRLNTFLATKGPDQHPILMPKHQRLSSSHSVDFTPSSTSSVSSYSWPA